LDRAAHAGRSFSRWSGVPVRRCSAYLGTLRRLRHECGYSRRHEFVLDAGGRHQGLGQ
jgi:hypothetical protein